MHSGVRGGVPPWSPFNPPTQQQQQQQLEALLDLIVSPRVKRKRKK